MSGTPKTGFLASRPIYTMNHLNCCMLLLENPNLSEKGYSILPGSLWYIIWRNLDVQPEYEPQHEILVQQCGMCNQPTQSDQSLC